MDFQHHEQQQQLLRGCNKDGFWWKPKVDYGAHKILM